LDAYSLLLIPLDVHFSLKEKVLMWKFEFLGSRAHLCACSLFLGIFRWFLLVERESLDLEGLSFRERKFNLRESLDGRLGSLERSPWWES